VNEIGRSDDSSASFIGTGTGTGSAWMSIMALLGNSEENAANEAHSETTEKQARHDFKWGYVTVNESSGSRRKRILEGDHGEIVPSQKPRLCIRPSTSPAPAPHTLPSGTSASAMLASSLTDSTMIPLTDSTMTPLLHGGVGRVSGGCKSHFRDIAAAMPSVHEKGLRCPSDDKSYGLLNAAPPLLWSHHISRLCALLWTLGDGDLPIGKLMLQTQLAALSGNAISAQYTFEGFFYSIHGNVVPLQFSMVHMKSFDEQLGGVYLWAIRHTVGMAHIFESLKDRLPSDINHLNDCVQGIATALAVGTALESAMFSMSDAEHVPPDAAPDESDAVSVLYRASGEALDALIDVQHLPAYIASSEVASGETSDAMIDVQHLPEYIASSEVASEETSDAMIDVQHLPDDIASPEVTAVQSQAEPAPEPIPFPHDKAIPFRTTTIKTATESGLACTWPSYLSFKMAVSEFGTMHHFKAVVKPSGDRNHGTGKPYLPWAGHVKCPHQNCTFIVYFRSNREGGVSIRKTNKDGCKTCFGHNHLA